MNRLTGSFIGFNARQRLRRSLTEIFPLDFAATDSPGRFALASLVSVSHTFGSGTSTASKVGRKLIRLRNRIANPAQANFLIFSPPIRGRKQ
jgi:hypothetical protein